MNEKVKEFLKNNIIVFIWAFLFVAFELIGITFAECKPILTSPLYFIIIMGFFLSILLLLRTKIAKAILSGALLIVQGILNVGFVYLYDSNGTYFEWAMFNQRNDAFATIEELHLRTELVVILLALLFLFIVTIVLLFVFYYKDKRRYKPKKSVRVSISIVLIICCLSMLLNPIINATIYNKQSYADRYLYGDATNKYQKHGITANAIYEFFNGTVVDSLMSYDDSGIEEFVYEAEDPLLQTSEYFGISKGNNLVYILVESFEWYVFLQHCTPEQSLQLFPNINKFLSSSVYADSFYSREKTDTAEMLSILGSNPTNKYVNYNFPTNDFSWSLPNMFRESVEDNGNTVKQIKSYHQNSGKFYKRNVMHESMGFDELVSIEDMAEFGLEGSFKWDSWKRQEMTLDSLTLETMKNEMFPATEDGEQFMTFWITYIMHGSYNYNVKFDEAGYYDKLDEVGAYPAGISKKDDYMRTYAASVMDFDKALGIMMDTLEANGQLDDTTIVLFSDHNTYYHNLANYAKDIDTRYNSELFRIPMMIYDEKFVPAYIENEGTNVISKFTTTADLIPTVFDLFGIRSYKNLYFGTSMLVDDVESIIFSRAYGIFVTDKLVCFGINDLLYRSEDLTKEYIEEFKERAEVHLEKLEYIDKIMNTDYFKYNPFKKVINN